MVLSYNTWVRSSSCALVVFVLLSWLMLFGQQEDPLRADASDVSPEMFHPTVRVTQLKACGSSQPTLGFPEREKREVVEVVLNILDQL